MADTKTEAQTQMDNLSNVDRALPHKEKKKKKKTSKKSTGKPR